MVEEANPDGCATADKRTAGKLFAVYSREEPTQQPDLVQADLFGSQSWGSGFHGKHVVEECTVPVEVIFDGKGQGFRNFRITHDDTRQDNNNTPNSWLHYDAALIADLQAKNMTGKSATIERLSSGSYRLTVG